MRLASASMVRAALAGLAFAFAATAAAKAETVSEFLARCDPPKEKGVCYADIDSATDQLAIRGDKTFCPPDFANLPESQIIENWAVITKWMEKRPRNEDAEQALEEGWRWRYPCPGPK